MMNLKKNTNDLEYKGMKKHGFFSALAFSFCMLTFVDASAQTGTVSVDLKNGSIKDLFNVVEKQTSYRFSYREVEVKGKDGISVSVKNESLKNLLTRELSKQQLSYKVAGNKIIIIPLSRSAVSDEKIKCSGKVVDAKGEPIIGATIKEQNTSNGTITDFEGNFTLDVAASSALEVSYIGYKTQVLTAQKGKALNVTLLEDAKTLDEVVVTALGIKRAEKALTYNVQQVKGDKVTAIKDANFMSSLSGKVAGVNINSSASGVGGAVRVVMRGVKSISNNNNALYVIDGMPIFNVSKGDASGEYANAGGEGISDINPEDIESMTVLTGASAAALYGSDAANGVIVINTKKGAIGKPKVVISNSTTFSNPFILPEFQNRYANKAGIYKSWGEKLDASSGYEPKSFFNTGVNIQNNISISSGNERQQMYLSAGTTNAKGIMPNHGYERYNFTFRSTTTLWNDKLSLDYGGSFIIQKDKNSVSQGKYYNPLVSLYTFPRGEDFSAIQAYERFDAERNMTLQYWPWGDQDLNMQNPYWIQNKNLRENRRMRYMLHVNAKYDFTDWLNLAARVKVDNTMGESENKFYASTIEIYAGPNGTYRANKELTQSLYTDLLLNIDKTIGDFSISANIGGSMSKEESDLLGGGGKLEIPNFFALPNVQKQYRGFEQRKAHSMLTMSTFMNAELGWKSKVYLTLTARNDWASSLSNTEQMSFFYPSVGLSGILTEIFNLPDMISYVKVRASYAEVGSALPVYLSTPTYRFNDMNGYYETYTRLVPDKLYPELTHSWELGINTKFFGNKLNFDLTYYKTNTDKQTFQIPISATSGYSSMIVQSGRVENQGIELNLGTNLNWGKFGWNSNFIYTFNRNKIKSMVPYYTAPDGTVSSLDRVTKASIDGGAAEFILTEGGSMGDLYTKNVLKKDENGYYWVNSSNMLEIDTKTQKVGSVLPKCNLSWNNEFSYKNFRLGCLVSARVGGVVLSATQAYLDGFGVSEASAIARDNGGVPVNQGMISAETWYTAVGTGKVYSHYIYDATNVRLQEVILGYTIPKKWLGDICSIDLSVVGRNLWMIYCKAPFDPEATASTGTYYQGIDYFMQPSLRNFGFNIKATF